MHATRILLGMAENNAWSNEVLHRALSGLTDGEVKATRTSFFPTIHLTLTHILLVDWFYIDGLTESGRGRAAFEVDEPYATLGEITKAQRASDRRLVEFVRSLDGESALEKKVKLLFRSGPADEKVVNVLLHLFEHQIHHRGQVHAMMSGTKVTPPQLDEFFLDGDAPAREVVMQEIGLR